MEYVQIFGRHYTNDSRPEHHADRLSVTYRPDRKDAGHRWEVRAHHIQRSGYAANISLFFTADELTAFLREAQALIACQSADDARRQRLEDRFWEQFDDTNGDSYDWLKRLLRQLSDEQLATIVGEPEESTDASA